MAEIKDKRSTERTSLESVIPLSTPFELQLAVASSCNFKCIYCFQSDKNYLKKAKLTKGIMNFELYQKIIDDLDEFPEKIKVLRLMREGEPLVNKRFADMVRYAKKKQPSVKIDTTTNASLLTPERSDDIIDAGLDKVFISFQAINPEEFSKVAGVKTNFQKILENIIYFCENKKQCKVFIKVPDIGVNSESERQFFFNMFDKYADQMFIENIFPAWPNFDLEKLKRNDGIGYYNTPLRKDPVKVCTLPFYDLTITHTGIVTACSIDWEYKTNFGDVNGESLFEIWNNKIFNDFRRMQLKGERFENELCKKCDALEYCEPDIIDDYSEMILEKYNTLP